MFFDRTKTKQPNMINPPPGGVSVKRRMTNAVFRSNSNNGPQFQLDKKIQQHQQQEIDFGSVKTYANPVFVLILLSIAALLYSMKDYHTLVAPFVALGYGTILLMGTIINGGVCSKELNGPDVILAGWIWLAWL